MSSVFTVDLGSDAQKAQETFEKYYNMTIESGTKDVADAALNSVAEKTKAEVDAIISSVEATVQDIIDNGTDALYSSLGINEEVIEFARTIVSLASNATNFAGAAVLRGMLAINSFDTVNFPMSAYSAGLKAMYSIADVFFNSFLEAYGVYIETIIYYILDPSAALEDLKALLDEQLLKIEDMIDEQCKMYLGMSLAEIRYYCRTGINLYKQYKAARKAQREKAAQSDEEQQTGINATGTSTSISVDYSVNPDIMKDNMQTWLNAQRDSLYNAFLILQVKDAVSDMKSMVKCMTDVSLDSLAETMNSLDDLVTLLDDVGLGDDSTAIDLSLIPSLGLNDIYAALNSLTDTATLQNEIATLGSTMATSLVNSSSVSASVSKSTTYTIETDAETQAITITYYTDPTKSSIAKAVNKVLSSAQTASGTNMFSSANCKVIQEYTNNLYEENRTAGTGSVTITVNKYTINIVLSIGTTGSDSSTGTTSGLTTDTGTTSSTSASSSTSGSSVSLTVLEDEYASEESINSAETRRNTIALLHTAFSIIKALVPSLELIATLISNYKTNKAYVQGKSQESLYALFKECMGKLGLDKTASATGGTDENGNSLAVLYPVRTYDLYLYLRDELGLLDGSPVTIDITTETAIEINNWLAVNDTTASTVSTENPVTLYIDYTAINEEIECLENQSSTLESCSSKYQNGSFDNIANIEIVGDEIVYTDSTYPRMGSQILMAQMQGYSYDE